MREASKQALHHDIDSGRQSESATELIAVDAGGGPHSQPDNRATQQSAEDGADSGSVRAGASHRHPEMDAHDAEEAEDHVAGELVAPPYRYPHEWEEKRRTAEQVRDDQIDAHLLQERRDKLRQLREHLQSV